MEGSANPAPPSGSWLTGAQIGSYRIDGELGRGGMGVVYRATHLGLDKPVAIKVMGARAEANASAIDRLMAEGRTLAKLRHPNVVSVTDCGSYNGLPYIVLEYVEGGTVEDLFKRSGGHIEANRVVELLDDVLNGLAAAHAAKIIHRDLKPSNLLIDGQGRVRISDFGLAQAFHGEADVTIVDRTMLASPPTVTQGVTGPSPSTGTFGGTIQFMAPELHGQATGDERSDLFAVGVIVYYLLTGVKPGGKFAPASRLVAGLSSRWDAFIDRCIAQRPEDRFASADEALAALRALRAPAKRPWQKLAWVAAAAAVVAIASLFFRTKDSAPSGSSTKLNLTYVFTGFQVGDVIEVQDLISKPSKPLEPMVIVSDPQEVSRPARLRLTARRQGQVLFPPRELDFTRRPPAGSPESVFPYDSNRPSAVLALAMLAGSSAVEVASAPSPAAVLPTAVADTATRPEASAQPEITATAAPTVVTLAKVAVRFDAELLAQAPDVEVRIDGVVYPARQRETGVALPPGEHRLEVTHPRFVPHRETFRLEGGDSRVLSPTLVLREYPVHFVGLPPGASLAVDGVSRAVSGDRWSTPLGVGSHTATVTDAFREVSWAFVVADGEREEAVAPRLAGQWRERIEVRVGDQPVFARLVPPGEYRSAPVGTTDLPARTLRLKEAFFVAETEVSRALYAAVMGRTVPIYAADQAQGYVSAREWLRRDGFLARCEAATSGPLRPALPTEDEWEAAALSPVGAHLRSVTGGVAELALLSPEPSPWVVVKGGSALSSPAARVPSSRRVVPEDQRAPEWGVRLVFHPRPL